LLAYRRKGIFCSSFLAYDLMSSAEKVVMPLMAAATSVLATGRFKNEPAMIANPAAVVLRGSQLVIA